MDTISKGNVEDLGCRYRKYQKNVEIGGKAIIIFGVWSIIKFIASVLLGQQSLRDLLGIDPNYPEQFMFVLVVIMIVLLALTMVWHAYIGVSAIKYAQGLKKSRFFLVWAALMLVVTVCSIPGYFDPSNNPESLDTVIVSVLVDLSMSFALLDMIYSSFMMTRIKRQMG